MPEISLTDFVDFVISQGTPRITKVRVLKERGKYAPRFDFWRPLREAIEEFHKTGKSVQWLEQLASAQSDAKKQARYPGAVQGYKRFLRNKSPAWFDPPFARWQHAGLAVRVNPELGLTIADTPYVLKLYFKAEPLSKRRVDVITHLLEVALRRKAPKGAAMGIVDVERGRLILQTTPVSGLNALLAGEAAAFATMWDEV